MKRILHIVLLTISIITFGLLVGCDPDNPLGDKGLAGEQKGEEVIGYLKSDDSESLKDMFCDELRNRDDFDEKINEIMEFIDGVIISYENVGGSGGRGETWECLYPGLTNIETDKGKSYKIYMSIYIKNENPNKLGMHQFQIHLLGDKNENGDRMIVDGTEVILYTE